MSGHAGHVDDRSATRGTHMRNAVLAEDGRRQQVDGEDAGHGLLILVLDGAYGHDGGVVDQDIDPAEPGRRVVHEGPDPVVVGDVQRFRQDGSSRVRDQATGLRDCFGVDVAHRYRGAFPGERQRDPATDSVSCARNDRGFVR